MALQPFKKTDLAAMTDTELRDRRDKMEDRWLIQCVPAGVVAFAVLSGLIAFTAPLAMIGAGLGLLAGIPIAAGVFYLKGENAQKELWHREEAAAIKASVAASVTAPVVEPQKPAAPDFNREAAVTLDRDVAAMRPLQLGHQPKQIGFNF